MARVTVTTGKGQPNAAAAGAPDAAPASGWRASGTSRQRGFTLIELLIVVTLIVVLAGIGLSTYSTSVSRAKEAVLRENLFRLRDSIDQFHADKGTYPPDLSALVTGGYLRQVPKDPFTESADTWQIVMSEPDPANPNAPPGVYDVKSGAQGVSVDGTPYADFQ
jgi:general secretion pathway protein G